MLKILVNALLDFFYPPKCPNCGEKINENYFLCADCRGKNSFIRVYDKFDMHYDYIDEILVLAHYRGGFQSILNKIKFEREEVLIPVLVNELEVLWNDKGNELFLSLLSKFDKDKSSVAVVHIPTDEERLKDRGYDLPEKIFRQWSKNNGFSWCDNCLQRKRNTPPQYILSSAERKMNMAGVFEAKYLPNEDIILLVDDIITTGSTIFDAARAIREIEKSRKIVFALSLAGDMEKL